MNNNKQKGQALILIALGIVGLIGITALSIDGGNAFSEKRKAQNAADTAAMAGALKKISINPTSNSEAINAALALATQNGFTSGDGFHTVTASIPPVNNCKGSPGPYFGNNNYIQVLINSNVDTYFAMILGEQFKQTHSCVEAVARFKVGTVGPLFFGNAVVGLDPDGTSYLAWSNAQKWNLHGGGVFSNNNAIDKHSNVVFHDGTCVTAVGSATGFTGCTPSQNQTAKKFNFPEDITPLLPRIPACDGVAYLSGGKIYPETGKDGSRIEPPLDWTAGGNYQPGLYCVTDAGGNVHELIKGTEVTFYIMDEDFTMKFNGNGAFAATAPTNGEYAHYLMFSHITPTPCTQNIELRGNGSEKIIGTVFLPSACIDWRGNSTGGLDQVQLIGYDVSSNGSANIVIYYDPTKQGETNIPAEIELTQ